MATRAVYRYLAVALLCACPSIGTAEIVDVILQGGQSNCDGRGHTSELPAPLQAPISSVRLFHGNGGGNCQPSCPPNAWLPLQPGSASLNKKRNQFGPEISMGHGLAKQFPERKFHILKLTKGGSHLHGHWKPGSGAYHAMFIKTVDAGLEALKAEGKTPRIVAMIWHQGESDCKSEEVAKAYGKNLEALITDIRNRYGKDLPFILGRLSSHQKLNAENRAIVQEAQKTAAATISYCESFDTDMLPLQKDQLHYATKGVIQLGDTFAKHVARYVPERPILELWPDMKTPNGWKVAGPESAVRTGSVTRIKNVNVPTIKVYPASGKPTGQGILIAPGGGYNILAYDKEGEEIAEWLSSLGISAFVLKYRLPKKGDVRHEVALQDAQRAMSIIRTNAATYHISPNNIGMMGFSAGGHLTAVTSTATKRTYPAIDTNDSTSFLPNFSIFLYPAYFLQKKTSTKLKSPIEVSPKTPPAFFVHCKNDRIPFQNSVIYGGLLKEAGINSEIHLYETGGHGYGMRPRGLPVDDWPTRLAAWLKQRQ